MKQRGFTLIEVIVVSAIIAILVAVIIPALIGQRERARNNATKAMADAVAAEIIHERNQGLITDGNVIIANIMNSGSATVPVQNFKNAKNPWNEALAPFIKGTAGIPGQVGMVVGVSNEADGSQPPAIVVTYMTQVNGAPILVNPPTYVKLN